MKRKMVGFTIGLKTKLIILNIGIWGDFIRDNVPSLFAIENVDYLVSLKIEPLNMEDSPKF